MSPPAIWTPVGAEIMALLERLNSEGMTILMVTHDPQLGTHAARIIHLKDGKILQEEAVKERRRAEVEARPAGEGRVMSPFELARVSMETVAANKLRSGLTMLGVAIGSMAIILLLSLSLGMNQQITSVVEGLGSNLYLVLSGAKTAADLPKESTDRDRQQFEAAACGEAAKGERTPDHGVASFQCPDHHQLWEDVQERHLRHGGDAELPQGAWPVERGTFVRQTDVDLTRRVVAIGKTVETLFERNRSVANN